MKKYRRTKITVKTREIISMTPRAAAETFQQLCPHCHAPLGGALSSIKNSGASVTENRPARLLSASIFDNQNEQY